MDFLHEKKIRETSLGPVSEYALSFCNKETLGISSSNQTIHSLSTIAVHRQEVQGTQASLIQEVTHGPRIILVVALPFPGLLLSVTCSRLA